MRYLHYFEYFDYKHLISQYNDFYEVDITRLKEDLNEYSIKEEADLYDLTIEVLKNMFLGKIITINTQIHSIGRGPVITGIVIDVDCSTGSNFDDYELYLQLDEYPEESEIEDMYDYPLTLPVQVWNENSEKYKQINRRRIQKRFDL